MVYGINRRLDKVEAKINKLQGIATNQPKWNREDQEKKNPQGKNEQSSSEPWDNLKWSNITVIP